MDSKGTEITYGFLTNRKSFLENQIHKSKKRELSNKIIKMSLLNPHAY